MDQQNIKRFWPCRWRKNPNNDGTSSWEQLRYVLVSAEVSLFGPLCSLYFQEAHEGEMLSSRWNSPGRNVCKTRINQSLISLTWLKFSATHLLSLAAEKRNLALWRHTLTAHKGPCISYASQVILDSSDHKYIWQEEVLQTYRHLLFFETLFAERRSL